MLREGMRTVIGAMRGNGVRRIVNLSGAAIDAPGDRKPTGRYRAGLDVLRPGARISRADIAHFMLAQDPTRWRRPLSPIDPRVGQVR